MPLPTEGGPMIRVNLPAADVERLEQTLRTTADAKLRHRVQIVLMAHRGRPHGDIATDLACSRSSVQVITGAVHANTLESPKDARRKTGKSKTRRLQEAFAA